MTITFNNSAGDGDWGNPANWDSGALPGAEDDCIITSDVSGTAASAVAALTVGSWTTMAAAVSAMSATFQPGSSLAGVLSVGGGSGTATFYSGAHINAGAVLHGCGSFWESSYNNGTVNGNAAFYESAQNGGGAEVNGNASFYGTSVNNGTVNGEAYFGETAQHLAGVVNGPARFDQESANQALISNTSPVRSVFSGSAINHGNITAGGADFHGTAANWSTVAGDCTFDGDAVNYGDLMSGSCEFLENASNQGAISEAIAVTFGGSAYNYGAVNAAAVVFGGYSSNQAGAVTCGTCEFKGAAEHRSTQPLSATCFFRDSSINRQRIAGSAVFEDDALNDRDGVVEGSATFRHRACQAGQVQAGGTLVLETTQTLINALRGAPGHTTAGTSWPTGINGGGILGMI